ncbi:MAG: helix-turn-helix transcriptional regulator [Flavobacteriales bacterium]|nr:helix-turn-helix transcriptional regulator [Flavobacteriales bacterium]MCB9335691.1 helix-turn-helix transcriptional regulator [Flavobacteriales bacterium]
MNKLTKFITEATQLFTKYGIKSLTMDDIARHLGMSKKTVYQLVKDKKDLVKKGMQFMITDEQTRISEIFKASNSAIEEMIGLTKCISTKLGDIHPSVIYDLQKYHPEAWKIMQNHKEEFVYNLMLNNLKRGIKEGYYRKNLNPELIASIYINMMDNILNPEILFNSSLTLEQLHTEIITYHIKGIANEKGVEVLKELMKKEENTKLSFD